MRLSIYEDGDAWCCIDEDFPLPEGLAGFGKTPAEAIIEFGNLLVLTEKTT